MSMDGDTYQTPQPVFWAGERDLLTIVSSTPWPTNRGPLPADRIARMFYESLVEPGYLDVGLVTGACGQSAPLQFYRPADNLWQTLDRRPAWSAVYAGTSVIIALLSERPDLVAGKKVYEIGCGSGLASIAAARSGAVAVTATDKDPAACAATAANALLNGVEIDVRQQAATDSWPNDVGVLLAGDVLNNRSLKPAEMEELAHRIDGFRASGGTVIVGDTSLSPKYCAEQSCLPAWARAAIKVPGANVVVLGPLSGG